jgi:hypothetical protein
VTYQLPGFNFLHAGADAGVGSMTSSGVESAYPLDNLIDYRPSSLCKFDGTTSNEWIKIDRGTGTLEDVDRFIMPAGHNLATCDLIRLHSSTNDADWTLLDGWNQTSESDPDGIIDRSFTATDDRWVRFTCLEAGTVWETTQLWWTNKRTPTIGPEVPWTEEQVPNTVTVPFPSRTAALSLAGNRWRYDLTYNMVSGTDLTLFDDLIDEVGVDLLPFYFDCPDDTAPVGPLLMRIIASSYSREQQHPTPSGSATVAYRIRFSMLEEIG